VHTGTPEVQVMEAVRQGLAGAQRAPELQTPQVPLPEQNRFVPQVVPAAEKLRSVQTAVPEPHS
jgi:hypothetical protein